MRILALLTAVLLYAVPTHASSPVIWGSPAAKLLTKDLKWSVSDTTTTCDSAAAGNIRYNAGTFQGCNGSAWYSMSAASASAVLADDGSSSAPSISFSADTNTGIYRSAADTMDFVAGGQLGMEIKKATLSYANVAYGGGAASLSEIYPIIISRDQDNTVAMAISNVQGGASAAPKLVLIGDTGAASIADIALHPAAASVHAYTNSLAIRSASSAIGISLLAVGAANSNLRFYTDGGASTDEQMRIVTGKVKLLNNARIFTAGTAPTVSSCGTSPSAVTGNSSAGRLTVGTGPPTSCTLTFAATWTIVPFCFVNDETTTVHLRASPTATTLVIAGTFVANDVITYHCLGYE